MKTLKFKPHLAEMIRTGEKTLTWRMFDDKNISVGDELEMLENDAEKPFAIALVTKVAEKQLGSLAAEDWIGHERFSSDEEMYQTYTDYYKQPVGPETIVKIIWFDLQPLASSQ